MNYEEARAFIAEISVRGSELGLKTIADLLEILGNPQDELKFIHVAGTNGKGSVLAYLFSVLKEAGYKVGRYISPTLFSYRERIQVGDAYISREDFAQCAGRAAAAVDELRAQGKKLPTVFEVETAISFLYFRKTACDLVLLEVGMGGRLDATNIIRTPVLTVITSVSMDHMEFLGNTLAEIAWNKAGILKPGVPVVSARQRPEAEAVIRREAAAKGCPCTFVRPQEITDSSGFDFTYKEGTDDTDGFCGYQSFSYGSFGRVQIGLAGLHQQENAALALECIGQLRASGYEIPDAAVREGLRRTVWKGRFSVIHRAPLVVIDGAHNPDAAAVLRRSLEEYFPDRKKFYIFGVFSDKEYDKIIEITAGLAEHIYTVETPDNPRALPARELALAVAGVNPSVEAAGSIADAVEKSFAAAGSEDVIIAFGSLSFLAEVERAVKEHDRRKPAGGR